MVVGTLVRSAALFRVNAVSESRSVSRESSAHVCPVTDEHVVCAGAPPTISSSESIIDGNGMPPTIDAIDFSVNCCASKKNPTHYFCSCFCNFHILRGIVTCHFITRLLLKFFRTSKL